MTASGLLQLHLPRCRTLFVFRSLLNAVCLGPSFSLTHALFQLCSFSRSFTHTPCLMCSVRKVVVGVENERMYPARGIDSCSSAHLIHLTDVSDVDAAPEVRDGGEREIRRDRL